MPTVWLCLLVLVFSYLTNFTTLSSTTDATSPMFTPSTLNCQTRCDRYCNIVTFFDSISFLHSLPSHACPTLKDCRKRLCHDAANLGLGHGRDFARSFGGSQVYSITLSNFNFNFNLSCCPHYSFLHFPQAPVAQPRRRSADSRNVAEHKANANCSRRPKPPSSCCCCWWSCCCCCCWSCCSCFCLWYPTHAATAMNFTWRVVHNVS